MSCSDHDDFWDWSFSWEFSICWDCLSGKGSFSPDNFSYFILFILYQYFLCYINTYNHISHFVRFMILSSVSWASRQLLFLELTRVKASKRALSMYTFLYISIQIYLPNWFKLVCWKFPLHTYYTLFYNLYIFQSNLKSLNVSACVGKSYIDFGCLILQYISEIYS